MNRHILITLPCLLMIIAIPVLGFIFMHWEEQSSLSGRINRLINDSASTANIGIEIRDPETGTILYQKNADHYFMPASNEKLFTAAAALDSLNENFAYETKLFADTDKIKRGVLNGNIYLIFTGDPELTFQQLDHLVHALFRAGIRQINGKIVIDDSSFDQMSMSPGTTWDDRDFCWGSPVHAITIDHNCITATLVPGAKENKPVIVLLPDHPQSMKFVPHVRTGGYDEADCSLEIKRINMQQYAINGCIRESEESKNIAMAIDEPRANAKLLLSYLLKKNNIKNTNHFEFKNLLIPPAFLASEFSPPLPELLIKMLKESDNIIASALFKSMGLLYSRDIGSFKNGSEAVRNTINNSMQLNTPEATIVDGSGLSRYDLLTPHQIIMLLQKMYSSKHGSYFINALPTSGVDGTLKKRMTDTATFARVHAKTGTVSGVSTLSGYLKTRHDRMLIFSIMFNGFVDSPKSYQDMEDKICALMVEQG